MTADLPDLPFINLINLILLILLNFSNLKKNMFYNVKRRIHIYQFNLVNHWLIILINGLEQNLFITVNIIDIDAG